MPVRSKKKGNIMKLSEKNTLKVLENIKKELEEEKKAFNYPNIDIKLFEVIRQASDYNLLRGRSLERGFSAVGLVIADPKIDFSNSIDRWYGYLIIQSEYYRELTWMMNKILRLFKDYFIGMEAREYLYDHIGACMKNSLKTKKINEVFKDVLEEADRLIQEAIKFHQKTT